jgi:hypothetical protein
MRHFQEKETKATATKTERSGTTTTQTEGGKKTEERKTDIPSKKSNLFDKNPPRPLEIITSRNRKRQILTSRLGKKKKKKRKESMSKKLEGEFAS